MILQVHLEVPKEAPSRQSQAVETRSGYRRPDNLEVFFFVGVGG